MAGWGVGGVAADVAGCKAAHLGQLGPHGFVFLRRVAHLRQLAADRSTLPEGVGAASSSAPAASYTPTPAKRTRLEGVGTHHWKVLHAVLKRCTPNTVALGTYLRCRHG